ncbi:MAG: hydroxymethylbilane synthase [Pseudomonadota bacterium]|nr:hydroxymethylbilane synthase [Pseudomonadota bacterium]
MTAPSVRIGTRGTRLALAQANEVRRCLAEAHKELAGEKAIEVRIIRTSGDRLQQGSLSEVGGKGLFTKEIEKALLDNEIDIAVHSMKDVPTWLPDGLEISCFLPRADPRDALISPGAKSIESLPEGITVGTASLRRKAMLLHRRPDVRVVSIRGSVDTRLAKLSSGVVDATFLAVAGLNRLGCRQIGAVPIDPEEMLPAVCQGIIGVERRSEDVHLASILSPLHDVDTEKQVIAERALLGALDGSCRTPIAAFAEFDHGKICLRAAIVRPDGSELLETKRFGLPAEAAALGRDAAAELRHRAAPGFFDNE